MGANGIQKCQLRVGLSFGELPASDLKSRMLNAIGLAFKYRLIFNLQVRAVHLNLFFRFLACILKNGFMSRISFLNR